MYKVVEEDDNLFAEVEESNTLGESSAFSGPMVSGQVIKSLQNSF